MGIWEEVREKIIEAQGDISNIEGLPPYLKEIYKTSFTTSPFAFIEVAARAQKWVDQALSRNMYLQSRDMDDLKQVYMSAWKKGLKTTYYLHMKPRHTAEQSTTNVNKQEMTGKRGFGAIKLAAAGMSLGEPSPVQVDIPSPIIIPETVMVAKAETEVVAQATEQPAQRQVGFSAVANAEPTTSKPMVGFASVASSVGPITTHEVSGSLNSTYATTKTQNTPTTLTDTPKKKEAPMVCPVDPQEKLLCDSCQ